MVPSEEVEENIKTRWVDIKLAQKKGFKFYQTRSNAIILLRHTPSLLYPKSYQDGNWRNHVRESICVASTSSEDSLKDNWMKELDSEVAGGSKDVQQIQPKTERLVSEQPPGLLAEEIGR